MKRVLGTDVCLYVHALGAWKISHCLLHVHQFCGCCAAEAASLFTTTSIDAECASNNLAN